MHRRRSASWTGALLCSGRAGSGRGAAKAAGAAVPVMNRFSRPRLPRNGRSNVVRHSARLPVSSVVVDEAAQAGAATAARR
ncbi:hypothetical protein I552_8364 [Mycobacterium xenopi 3993]|nr:hypothetical protein I552_8364 [Mycobacterium xenopi 3993]